MKRLDNNIGFFSPRAAGRIIKPGVCEINKKKRGEKKKKNRGQGEGHSVSSMEKVHGSRSGKGES